MSKLKYKQRISIKISNKRSLKISEKTAWN